MENIFPSTLHCPPQYPAQIVTGFPRPVRGTTKFCASVPDVAAQTDAQFPSGEMP